MYMYMYVVSNRLTKLPKVGMDHIKTALPKETTVFFSPLLGVRKRGMESRDGVGLSLFQTLKREQVDAST